MIAALGGSRRLVRLLDRCAIQPVLVDIGAAGTPPRVWRSIAAVSTIVAADATPGSEIHGLSRFRRIVNVPQAIVPDDRTTCTIHVTRLPECSSTLPPDSTQLAKYVFADLFDVDHVETVPCGTLAAALERNSIDIIDWLKLDTQGTDLRLFQSLTDRLRNGLLAVDIEPGLVHAYENEDLFTDAHSALLADGFWLSRLDVMGTWRVAAAVRAALAQENSVRLSAARPPRSRNAPAWCEARYLRTVESLNQHAAEPRQYLCLAIFALVDDQPGHAAEVMLDYRHRFGDDDLCTELLHVAFDRLKPDWATALAHTARAVGGRLLRHPRSMLG